MMLKVTQLRSAIGSTDRQKATLRGLGLRGVGKSSMLVNSPAVRGMVKRVLHLVSAELVQVGGEVSDGE